MPTDPYKAQACIEECCAVPGPQPCNDICKICQRGTRPRTVRLTVSGVVERAGFYDAHPTNAPRYKAGCDSETNEACTIAGDETTDRYCCTAINRTYTFGCDPDCAIQSPCAWVVSTGRYPGFCSPPNADCDSISVTVSYEGVYAPGSGTPLSNKPGVQFSWGAMPQNTYEDDIANRNCAALPPAGETGTAALFVSDQTGSISSPFDCSAASTTLTQYLVESDWCPCDFSNAVVTLEILEYMYITPDTLFLTISGTCLDDDTLSTIQLDYNSVQNRYEGVINCGEKVLNVWFSCYDEPVNQNPCLDANHADAQGAWLLQIFDTSSPDTAEECFVAETNRSTAQDPFLWEKTASGSAAFGCCECTTEALTFTITE